MLDKFVQTEIIEVNTPEHDGMYQIIRKFVQSPEIRCGELEGHCFVIHKIHKDAFVLYEEYLAGSDTIYPNKPFVVDRATLLESIDKAAKKIGIIIPKDIT